MQSTAGSVGNIAILLVEQDAASAFAITALITECFGQRADLTEVNCGREAARKLRDQRFEFVFADLESIADIAVAEDGAIARLSRLLNGGLLIALSSGRSVSATVAAMQAGAHDCLSKLVTADTLSARIEELSRRHRKACNLSSAHTKPIGDCAKLAGLVYASNQMRLVADQVERAADSASPVFLIGEPGVGKRAAAEALHAKSDRADKPMAVFDCATIPRDVMEIELFGVSGGTYTGAETERAGRVELAAGGTLFIREIGEMDLGLQTKLLRFLQTGNMARVGDGAPRQVDVRVICGTSCNPMQLIAEKRFREDLFYYLHALPIHLPPLRQRSADILPLADFFLQRYAAEEHRSFGAILPDASDLLMTDDWRQNVRQLRDVMRRVAVMYNGGSVSAEMIAAANLDRPIADQNRYRQKSTMAEILPMWRQEQKIIEDAIIHFQGNIALAAAALEISPSTIYRKRQGWEMLGSRVA